MQSESRFTEDDITRAISATATSIAIAAERLRKVNPMNGDGSNNMLDRILAEIDDVVGSRVPGTCATAERARLQAERDADYLRMNDA